MIGGGRAGLGWNLYFGAWAVGLVVWDQKWGLLVGLAIGGYVGYSQHP